MVNAAPVPCICPPIASCLTLAAKVDGREIITIEGIADGDNLHPMQQAFIDHDTLQCGYCTPGQIMTATACAREGHATSRKDIREYMSGNNRGATATKRR
ncbi:(2Fe-2S)-binding protein [Sphingomonas kyeonggiensis]|uniref:Aerobic-type carbon monoxide dehydrogenase small subunit (CoxS/CutS family) n=1 Tax=Sphingomonas kyeonggiensis TaxID=1268553 RepID=A0A7W6JTU8_9SPHN|nr:aerobic-type carbon monoxide dehydrogenase small subunit (CoxS/CutS family) [Sphingomonas kyeonggiensis]